MSTSVAAPSSPAPSVPISLYREVASELQTTQTTLESLKAQNQELTQKNQQLRLEIERVVQSALRLRQVADPTWGGVSGTAIAQPPIPAELLAPKSNEPSILPTAPATPEANALFTEQEMAPVMTTASESAGEISTWWLILIICLIVITAFGTGFLIVRPLLPSR